MNKNLYSQENIDSYLTNRLSAMEKQAFEDGLAKDPLLKNEIKLQADIIKSIQQARRMELKARLNNIEITPASSYLRYQIAASVIAALGIIGSIFYFQNDDLTPLAGNITPETKNITLKNNSEKPSKEGQSINFDKDILATKKVERNISASPEKKVTPSINNSNPSKNNEEASPETPSATPEVNILDNSPSALKSVLEEEEIHPETNLVVPNGEVVESESDLSSEVEVSIVPKGNNNFHYQFYTNKLYLYCDFNSQPYELIELNKKGSKKLYLHFNNSYYQLKNNQVEIAPLTEIKDVEIINQLESIKHK